MRDPTEMELRCRKAVCEAFGTPEGEEFAGCSLSLNAIDFIVRVVMREMAAEVSDAHTN